MDDAEESVSSVPKESTYAGMVVQGQSARTVKGRDCALIKDKRLTVDIASGSKCELIWV